MVSSGFDQIAEEASSETASDRGTGGREKRSTQRESQIRGLACQAKGKEPQQKEESSAPKKVTSQMLLNKFQRDQERRQYREESA